MPAHASPADIWDEFHRVRAQFGAPVAEAYARAEGYVWGWQDAIGPDAADSDQATQFAEAWAVHYAEHLAAPGYPVRSIDRCWQSWRDCGRLAHPPRFTPAVAPAQPSATVIRAADLLAGRVHTMCRWALSQLRSR
ncbi:hypothetical protein [Nocardia blacklockiae]|uniref:hypothetical protein n=1 Tax=Nocardia blacklockiae TaxID=480036 RepID=UPI0018936A03|nr:hypothetical protein [Nocardia blacklockiae]MBF6173595.1 hypothetical protein [Nocardia blacklockiae]